MSSRAADDRPRPVERNVAMMVTRRCNMTCAHCSVESGPDIAGEPTEDELVDWVRQAAVAGVETIRFTGGEPMLRSPIVLKLVRECTRLGMSSAITTNGFWGRTPARANGHLRALARAGLRGLTVSYDAYHADFQGPEPALHIAQAADALSLPMNLNALRGAGDVDLAPITRRLGPAGSARLRVYDLQPVGRARGLPANPDGDTTGFCTACSFPMVTDDGRLLACPGPAYFEAPGSPLVVGSLRTEPLGRLLERHRQDAILDVIRTSGPAGLRDELQRTPGFENFPFRPRYSGICDLCLHVTSSPEAVSALRERLSGPEAAAVRAAVSRVIDGNQRGGELTFSHINGPAAARVFFGALSRGAFEADAVRVLRHAHLDWRRLATYLAGCGLTRPFGRLLAEPPVTTWAPAFFMKELAQRALSDALREIVQREAIAEVADALGELGGRGVLLKGAALLVRAPEGRAPRATSDVDVLVNPGLAVELRRRLVDRGASGVRDGGPSTNHHLEPIFWRGVPVEIHTRIMPAVWRLPERDMLATARPLPGSGALATLGPEASALHAAVHLSASFFSFGLKTAWDLIQAVQDEAAFDWERLAAWADGSGAPRAFWVPVRVLTSGLDLPVPAAFLERAPVDAGARRAEAVAWRRVFQASEGLFDLDALTKTGLMLLLQDDWKGRARYLGSAVWWRTSRPTTWAAAVRRARRADVFGQAWRQYRRYRRVVSGMPRADVRPPRISS